MKLFGPPGYRPFLTFNESALTSVRWTVSAHLMSPVKVGTRDVEAVDVRWYYGQ